MTAVAVDGLRKNYGSHEVLHGIDFTVAQGEIFALLGPNGAGKTTALEILEGDEAEALLAKKRRSEKKDEEEEEVPDDGLYRGQKAYKSHIRKNQEVPKAMRVGPQRSNNSTIRTVTIVDYQPDVCKDYKGAFL